MFVLAIDAGTEAVKAGLVSESGEVIASGRCAYKTNFPQSGWAEQDPDEWWTSLVVAVKECLSQTSINLAEIKAICADATTCTLLPVKANGQHLRPALLWMDVRASEQAARIFQTQHEALRYTLAGVSAEWMPSKALWLKEHEPEIYNATDYFIEYTDWLAYKLTGRLTLNLNTVTQRWYYNTRESGWPLDFYNVIGLEDVEKKLGLEILPLGEKVGALSNHAANELGLPVGIPVIAGGGDAFVGLLGLGVVAPGDLALVTGSSNVLSALTPREVHIPGIFGSFPDAVISGLNSVEGGQVSTGSLLSWFKRNFISEPESASLHQRLDKEASQIPLGSEGLIVLEHFQGCRTPHTDSLSRGVLLGLTLKTTRAHVFRALMEGVAYGTKEILETFHKNGCNISRIVACGGATQSPLFMQIYADVLGQKIYTTQVPEASLLGSAVAAAYGAGWYKSLAEASSAMVKLIGEYTPNQQRHETYKFYASQYQKMYQALRPILHDVTRHVMNDEIGNALIHEKKLKAILVES